MAAVTIAMEGRYETQFAAQIFLHPNYHCCNLDAELIDFVKRYEELQHLI